MADILDKMKGFTSDAVSFFKQVAADVRKGHDLWVAINSPQTRALAVRVTADVLKAVRDVEGAAAAQGFNFVLDAELVSDAKQLIADAKAGDGVLKVDLGLLGIKL